MRKSMLAIALIALTTLTTALGVSSASAAQEYDSFRYTGVQTTSNRVLHDTGVVTVTDWFPGRLWFRAVVGIKSDLTLNQSAEFRLNTPDAYGLVGPNTLTTSLTPGYTVDGPRATLGGQAYLKLDIAYDWPEVGPWYEWTCSANAYMDPVKLSQATEHNTCLNLARHPEVILDRRSVDFGGTFLPFQGTASLSENLYRSQEIDIGAIVGVPGLVKVRLDLDAVLALTATDGYAATRTLVGSSPSSAQTKAIRWTGASNQTDTFALPASIKVGDQLVYRLSNVRWAGTATANIVAKVIVILPLVDNPSVTVGKVNVFTNAPVTVKAPDYSATIGTV
jgi:hypothetical protein